MKIISLSGHKSTSKGAHKDAFTISINSMFFIPEGG